MNSGLILALLASWYLVGLSVTVALVIYPAFDLVGATRWVSYHHHHVRRIAWAVGPAWLSQAVGLVWWWRCDHFRFTTSWLSCAVFAVAAVLLTVFRAVQLHDRLTTHFDAGTTRQLRVAHWWRTACWIAAAPAATVATWRR